MESGRVQTLWQILVLVTSLQLLAPYALLTEPDFVWSIILTHHNPLAQPPLLLGATMCLTWLWLEPELCLLM